MVILVDFIQKNFIIFTIFFSPSLLNDGEKSVPGLNLINLPDFKETIETNIPKDKTWKFVEIILRPLFVKFVSFFHKHFADYSMLFYYPGCFYVTCFISLSFYSLIFKIILLLFLHFIRISWDLLVLWTIIFCSSK